MGAAAETLAGTATGTAADSVPATATEIATARAVAKAAVKQHNAEERETRESHRQQERAARAAHRQEWRAKVALERKARSHARGVSDSGAVRRAKTAPKHTQGSSGLHDAKFVAAESTES
jgi:hypothetical protein